MILDTGWIQYHGVAYDTQYSTDMLRTLEYRIAYRTDTTDEEKMRNDDICHLIQNHRHTSIQQCSVLLMTLGTARLKRHWGTGQSIIYSTGDHDIRYTKRILSHTKKIPRYRKKLTNKICET